MSRAVQVDQPGSFRLVPQVEVTPRADEVVVEPMLVEVLPLDVQAAAGIYPGATFPLRPGQSGVARLDRKPVVVQGGPWGVGLTRRGLLADRVAVPQSAVFDLPAKLPHDVAATAVNAALTARLVLEDAELRSGETLLVLGAGGATGGAVVELGSALGARVLAAARHPEELQFTSDRVEVVGLDELPTNVADVVVDCLGGSATIAGIRAGATRCRHVLVGYVAGAAPEVPLPLLMLREHRLLGFSAFAADAARYRRAVGQAIADLAAGRVGGPPSTEFRIEDVEDAYAHPGPGRAVVRVR